MDFRLCLILFSFVCLTIAFDKHILKKEPPCMKHFDVERGYSGKWYIMLTLNPCSWSGANDFTDWYHEYKVDPSDQGLVHGLSTWRNGDTCVRVPLRLQMTGKSTLNVLDSIGDVATGSAVVVATDYTCFLLSWGCTKRGVGGRTCRDPWIDLKTRKPFITDEVRHIVDAILKKLWGITTLDLPETSHTKSCEVKG